MPLVEQNIPTLFQGVSRQPGRVRLTGQVQDADNMYPSVDTGGLERRPATQHIDELSALNPDEGYAIFGIDRDSDEKYIVAIGDNNIYVFDAFTGAQKTVNLNHASIPAYLTGDPEDFRVTSVADYTFIANKRITVRMDREPFGYAITSVGVSSITWSTPSSTQLTIVLNTGSGNGLSVGDWFKITATPAAITPSTLDGLWCRVSVDNGANQVTATMHDRDAPSSTITQVSYDGVLEDAPLVNFSIADFISSYGGTGTVTSSGTVAYIATKGSQFEKHNAFSALPTTPAGDLFTYKITPAPDDATASYWVQADLDAGVYNECPQPGHPYKLDYTTMPIKMVRDSDGSFEVYLWNQSISGFDEDARGAAPQPPFVDKTISDVFYHRNRFGFLSDDSLYTSRNGDVFQLFPEKASLALATDPVDLTASSIQVTKLRYAVPFRKELFLTSDTAQFEASGDLFTPDDARIDPSTAYQVDVGCKPVAMAEQVFFPAASEDSGIIYEYYLDGDTLSNTASNITKHAYGYLPPGMHQLATAALPERLFALPADDRSEIFVYTNYWNGQEKVQSAWTRLDLGTTETDEDDT